MIFLKNKVREDYKNDTKNFHTFHFSIYLKLILFFSLICFSLIIFKKTFNYPITSITKKIDEKYSLFSNMFFFKLRNINISGLEFINKKKFLELVSLEKNISLWSLKIDVLQKQIKNFDFVSEVTIKRVFPDTLEINIIEKKLIGISENDGNYKLISEKGFIINVQDIYKYAHLPIFSGVNVEKKANQILTKINKSGFKEDIWSINYINQRRWNLNLKKGIKILLPENKISSALDTLIKIQKKFNILDGNFIEIDMRNHKQLIFEPLLKSSKY